MNPDPNFFTRSDRTDSDRITNDATPSASKTIMDRIANMLTSLREKVEARKTTPPIDGVPEMTLPPATMLPRLFFSNEVEDKVNSNLPNTFPPPGGDGGGSGLEYTQRRKLQFPPIEDLDLDEASLTTPPPAQTTIPGAPVPTRPNAQRAGSDLALAWNETEYLDLDEASLTTPPPTQTTIPGAPVPTRPNAQRAGADLALAWNETE